MCGGVVGWLARLFVCLLGFNAVSIAMVISRGEQGWLLIQSLMIKSMR